MESRRHNPIGTRGRRPLFGVALFDLGPSDERGNSPASRDYPTKPGLSHVVSYVRDWRDQLHEPGQPHRATRPKF